MTNLALTEQDTASLMDLLTKRGYFHTGSKKILKEHSSCDDSVALRDQIELDKQADVYSSKDEDCQVIQTATNEYITRLLLTTKLQELLQDVGGRISQTDAAHLLDLSLNDGNDSQIIQQCMKIIIEKGTVIQVAEDYIVVKDYFDNLLPSIRTALLQANGCLSVSEIASTHELPLDCMLEQVSLRLATLNAKLVTMSGASTLVTPELEQHERARIRGAVQSLLTPTPIDAIEGWDASHVVTVVRSLLETKEVAGVLHESSATAKGALFVPTIYTKMQRQAMDQHYESMGFVTVNTCHSMGIAPSAMGEYMLETFPTATVLKEVVMDTERIVTPLVPVLQEAASENTFLDLRVHLSEALLSHEDDLLTIVKDMALPQISERGGEIVISDGEVLFVSSGMAKAIANNVLPPLIETFAKEEAERRDLMESTAASEEEAPATSGKKSSKKSKSKNASSSKKAATIKTFSVVPLPVVAQAIVETYPDLADIQESHGPLLPSGAVVPWDVDDIDDDDAVAETGPILDLCRQTIYTTAFQDACRLAVTAELERFQSTKKATSVRSRKDGAAKIRSVESSFEECFPEVCQQLSLQAKFLDYADTSDAVDTDVLRADFLRGSCADFASRITQYCLFKNELEGDVFSFHDGAEESSASSVPQYCQPIDRSARRIAHPYLSCMIDEDSQQKHQPLPTLRKVLSGNLGVTLARLWTYCGGECYDGGVVDEYIKPGNVNEFMMFVEENCLSICGMPFTKLNKKSEKQFLFARRQELTSALTATSDPATVLELTVMLLFQQIRGLPTVPGPHLTGPILKLLCHEKKMPEQVAAMLRALADQIGDDDDSSAVDAELVAKVKACGLSRDVAKHTVE